MNLLDELLKIQKDLNEIPTDNIPNKYSPALNRAKNRLMNVIADGERRVSQKGLKTVPQ